MRIQVHYRTIHPDNIKTRLCLPYRVTSTTPAKPAKSANPGTVCRANICVIKIQLAVVPCLTESKRSTNSPTNSLKWRRHFCESSQQFSVKREATYCQSLRFWWFWHIFDSFMSTFCRLFSLNCNWRTKMRTWVVFFYELWVSCSMRRKKWQIFVVETFI